MTLTDRDYSFTCKAQRTADPPQDCNWPQCGCDPYADKVLAALEEHAYRTHAYRTHERLQSTLDNIYTIARREVQRRTRVVEGEVHAAGLARWAHILRLCEDVGCQPRGVLRDNGGPVGAYLQQRQETDET